MKGGWGWDGGDTKHLLDACHFSVNVSDLKSIRRTLIYFGHSALSTSACDRNNNNVLSRLFMGWGL